jgi:uncharacterized protein (DUF2062 family)
MQNKLQNISSLIFNKVCQKRPDIKTAIDNHRNNRIVIQIHKIKLNYMPKKFIQRFSPKPETLKAHPHLKHFGEAIHSPNLWHLNRRSAAGAVAVGIFCAWMPMPFQMVLAAALAMFFTVNLPLSVALVWISNPLTMPAIFYVAYRLGAFILQTPVVEFNFELSFTWISEMLETIAPPLLLGSIILGLTCAALGYYLFLYFWHYKVTRKWNNRKK